MLARATLALKKAPELDRFVIYYAGAQRLRLCVWFRFICRPQRNGQPDGGICACPAIRCYSGRRLDVSHIRTI